MNRNTLLIAIAAASAATLTGVASAAPLTAGASIAAPLEPDPNGGGIVGFLATTYNGVRGKISGTLNTWVYAGDANNPYGGLTFVYQFNNTGPKDEVERLSLGQWTGWLTDVSYNINTGTRAPSTITRSLNDDVIGFNFPVPNAVPIGSTTYELVIQTNATSYKPISAQFINGDVANTSALGPDVPAPGVGVVMGLAGVFAGRRRR